MAERGYGCIFGDCTNQVNHLITTINPTASVETCDDHYAPALIPLLAADLGVDPGDFYSHVEKYVKREAAKADKALADAQAAQAAEGSQGPTPGTTNPPGGETDGNPGGEINSGASTNIPDSAS